MNTISENIHQYDSFVKLWMHKLFIAILFTGFISCKSSPDRNLPEENKTNREDLIRTHKNIMKDESNAIDEYIARRNYKMDVSPTGLRYMIYHNGNGKIKAAKEDNVKLQYTISLLNGTLIYSSDSTGAMEFVVGKSEIVNGIQEGVTYMHEGDKAIFILPAHLAYGLTGDGDQIKYYEALVVDAELISINRK
jgi:FKBP-type peptidyl-prolyl cis-trans isomerase